MHVALLNDPNNFHTQKWALALQQAGAQVTVFSYDAPQHQEFPAVRVPTVQPDTYRYRDYLRGGPALRAALDTHQIDLVNALNVTPFGVWAHQTGFRPVVASALGADLLEYPPRPSMSPLLRSRSWANVEGQTGPSARIRQWARRQYFRGKVRTALQGADLVTGDNQVLVDAAVDWFGVPREKVRLLRWGVEPELFAVSEAQVQAVRERWNIPQGARLVLSPRGAKAIYNADVILEGFAQALAQVGPEVHFLMLSAGYAVSERVQARAEALVQQYPNFHFEAGRVPREMVYALWNIVDVFVSAPVYDGYSAAVAEGRYAGSIPVVNDISGNREVITHQENGWMVDPFQPGTLAAALVELLAQLPRWQARFKEKNRLWIEKNSLVKENAKRFLDWGEELLRNRAL